MSAPSTTLSGRDWQNLITAAAGAISTNVDQLSRLDAAVGDGDHGVNVSGAMAHAQSEVTRLSDPLPTTVLKVTSTSFLNEMGGAAGALFGSFFSAMAKSFDGSLSTGTAQLADALEAGTELVKKRGKANIGDKTMVDALAPAADAGRAAHVSGLGMPEALLEVAIAARDGAKSTVSMTATLGRARYAGDSAIGVQDPGATTVALIFEAWASKCADLREGIE